MSQRTGASPLLFVPDRPATEVIILGLRLTPRALAGCAFLGWLPLLLISAFYLARLQVDLTPAQRVLRHVFETGQLLGLAFFTWVAHRLLWRFAPWPRTALAVCLLATATYGLLGGDLVSFLERHPETTIPWRALFTLGIVMTLMASALLGLLLARGSLWFVGVALGLLTGIANHLILPLQYPGMHVVLSFIAAHLIGMSVVTRLSALEVITRVRKPLIVLSGASLLSFLVVPSVAVRSALLASPGAVAAPFVAQLWTRLDRSPGSGGLLGGSSWFDSRRGMKPIPPDELPGAPEDPIVILLTVDALRGDLIDDPGTYGPSLANFTTMKKEALGFTRVWAPAPYTMGSLRSLFFGTYYLQQPTKKAELLRQAEGQVSEVPDRPSFVALLTQGGVSTFSVRTHDIFRNDARGAVSSGFEDGTDLERHAPADTVISEILKRLAKRPPGPHFIYSHLFEPHAPYDLGGKNGSQRDRYVAEVEIVDAQIARLRREIRKLELQERTYLIITSDHGEAFGEHGRNFHSTTVYEEMIRIPLLIEGPGVKPRQAKQAVSLVDLGPTVLSLFGVATPPHMVGQSLVPFMRGENPNLTRPLAVDGGRAIRAMLFDARYKAIVDTNLGTEEIYDLVDDPAERKNLAENPDLRIYITELRTFFAGLNERE